MMGLDKALINIYGFIIVTIYLIQCVRNAPSKV